MSTTSTAAEQRDLTTIQSDIEQALYHVHTLLEEYYSNASSKLDPYTPKVIEGKGFDIRLGEAHSVAKENDPYRRTEFKSNLKFTIDGEDETRENVKYMPSLGRDYFVSEAPAHGAYTKLTTTSTVHPRHTCEVFVTSRVSHSLDCDGSSLVTHEYIEAR